MGRLTLCQRIQTATKQYMLVLRYSLGSVYLEGVGVGGSLWFDSLFHVSGSLTYLHPWLAEWAYHCELLDRPQGTTNQLNYSVIRRSVEYLLKGSYCVITTPHIGTGPGNHKWLYSKQQSIILHSNRRIIYHVYHLFSFCCNTSK